MLSDTVVLCSITKLVTGLNAPYGAPCFLTVVHGIRVDGFRVLMHLMALRAF